MNSFAIMKWMGYLIVVPVLFLTLLAIPIHLSLGEHEARIGRYAHWNSEVFPYKDAVHAYTVNGFDQQRKEQPQWDLIVVFNDGRRLHANTGKDGGERADLEVIRLLLAKTSLTQESVSSEAAIPPP